MTSAREASATPTAAIFAASARPITSTLVASALAVVAALELISIDT